MTTTPPTIPAIAIVGRPNVGKSALFNRLAGRRIAVVHHSSGVTRDRLSHPMKMAGRDFNLIDTGGLEPPETVEVRAVAAQRRAITAAIRRQVETALAGVGVAIQVTDLQKGIVPLDIEAADFLRRTGRPVLLAANKADNRTMEHAAGEFHRLGFPVFPVSALHNRGLDALMRAAVAALPAAAPAAPDCERLKITVLGRPNTGKSSFINALLGDDRLIVSEMPGTTRDCVDVPFSLEDAGGRLDCMLTDTAGIRKINRLREAADHIGLRLAEHRIKRAESVILMLDVTQGPTAQDKRIARMVLDHAKGIVLALNKWDLLRGGRPQDAIAAVKRELPFLDFAPVICVSAQSGFNTHKAILAAARAAAETRRTITTGPLNRVIERATAQVQPPIIKGRRLKIFYATQTGVQPLTFTMFVNTPDRLTDAYNSFLIKRLRLEFGLEGAPVVLKCAHRPRTEV